MFVKWSELINSSFIKQTMEMRTNEKQTVYEQTHLQQN